MGVRAGPDPSQGPGHRPAAVPGGGLVSTSPGGDPYGRQHQPPLNPYTYPSAPTPEEPGQPYRQPRIQPYAPPQAPPPQGQHGGQGGAPGAGPGAGQGIGQGSQDGQGRGGNGSRRRPAPSGLV